MQNEETKDPSLKNESPWVLDAAETLEHLSSHPDQGLDPEQARTWHVFNMRVPTSMEWGVILGMSLVPLVVVQMVKQGISIFKGTLERRSLK